MRLGLITLLAVDLLLGQFRRTGEPVKADPPKPATTTATTPATDATTATSRFVGLGQPCGQDQVHRVARVRLAVMHQKRAHGFIMA